MHSKVLNVKVGTIQVITFRTTRNDHPITFAASGILSGLSSGHVALRLEFDDKHLFDKYIRSNKHIPHQIIIDPKTKRETYEVYLSFWPSQNGMPWADTSVLKSHLYDCEQSANFSEMNYNPKYASYLQPLIKIAVPHVPVAKEYLVSTVTLPPTIMLHSSRLQQAFTLQHNTSVANEVVLAAEKYTQIYHEWRAAVIDRQNAEYVREADPDLDPRIITTSLRNEKIAQVRTRIAERNLMQIMYPNEDLTHEQFIQRLEPFVTFGFPERDQVELPLVEKRFQVSSKENDQELYGLDLEPMLSMIVNIANNPKDYPYNVFDNNCARVALDILQQGTLIDEKIIGENIMELPWYVRWFGITITPTMIMQLAHKLEIRLNELNSLKVRYDKVANDDDYDCTLEIEPLLKTERRLVVNSNPSVMQFSHFDSGEDGYPTTRSGIMAKLLDEATKKGF